ncbi:MFS transporter [Inquilinus sp. OTU3971]|uniref:MFS transporter n=1 Tax=Inquilinus sp. OTU3971 TaxID=3043855 RepID=UPI00313E0737
MNFLLADVRGAVGPYLNVYLVTQRAWSQSALGLVTLVSGLAGLALQTPIGALIDLTRAKRGTIVARLAVLAIGASVIFARADFWSILVATMLIAVVGDVFGPAVSALTLGLIGRRGLARRMGRNAAYDHAGNVAIAFLAAFVGWWFSQRAVFLLVPVFALLAAAATLSIPARAIDHDLARGADRPPSATAAAPPAGRCCCAAGLSWCSVSAPSCSTSPTRRCCRWSGRNSFAHPGWATAMMSFGIVAAQAMMLPIAVLVGHRADRWGRKPIFLAGFAILPIRAVLYILSHDSGWLIAVQLLDGSAPASSPP